MDDGTGAIIVGESEEAKKKFFKYYKLYGIPESLGKTPVVDSNNNPVNISDYLEGFQPSE